MLKIKQARTTDAERIVDFQLKMAKETEDLELDKSLVAKGVKAVFDDPGKGIYYLADFNEQTAASLLITYEWSDWRNAWVWWIQSVYVLPEFRRKGIFQSMYRHITKLSETRSDVGGIRLYVDISNTRARKVYENIGMNGDHYQLFEAMKD
jgi:ribosomal protein S18 acetylase RimI-like enzyme